MRTQYKTAPKGLTDSNGHPIRRIYYRTKYGCFNGKKAHQGAKECQRRREQA